MTNDSNKNDTQPSSFRHQILHDLETLREERLGTPATRENEMDPLVMDEPVDFQFVSDAQSETMEEQATLVHKELPLEETLIADNVLLKQIPLEEEDTEDHLEQTLVLHKQAVTEATRQDRPTAKRSLRSQKRHRKQQEKAASRIAATVVVLVLLTLTITGFSGYFYLKSSLSPMDTKATEVVQIEIPNDSSTMEIGQILVKHKLIKNATVFNYYSKLKSYNNFQSGFYNLSQTMSVDELAKALQETGSATPQAPIAGKVAVIEGYTLEQIAQAVTKNVHSKKSKEKSIFTAEAFLTTVKNPEFINRMVATYPKLLANLPAADSGVKYQLEGYLFPATYDYTKETTMEQLVEQMLAAMDARLQPYYDQLAAKGLDVNQLLTLASLVEKEGDTDEDRRNIASVFYNRLNIDMPLQSNIAILYAMGKLGEKTTLAEDAAIDTQIASPYNIYTNPGLMPGPVGSPSMSAIEATFNPNKTQYYYFVADVTTGTVYYSATMEEHQKNVETYVNSKLSE